MKNNLELHKQINFDDLVKHGIENGANIVDGMPWSWKINNNPVTHENNTTYLIETMDGQKVFEKGNILIAYESGLKVFEKSHIDTHYPVLFT